MENRVDILQELRELNSILAKMEKVNVYTVPEGYFETIATIILLNNKEAIKAEVPTGYFDQLADSILNKIKSQQAPEELNAAAELRQLSPMLYSIQDNNVYTVPAGYFNIVADEVMAVVKPKAKLVSLNSRRSSFLKYAAAAVVASFITLSVIKVANKPAGKHDIAVASLDPSIVKGTSMSDSAFNDALGKLSADDIANYLEKNGNESDIAALSNNINDDSLPKQDDYILDQKALEKYLNDDGSNTTSN